MPDRAGHFRNLQAIGGKREFTMPIQHAMMRKGHGFHRCIAGGDPRHLACITRLSTDVRFRLVESMLGPLRQSAQPMPRISSRDLERIHQSFDLGQVVLFMTPMRWPLPLSTLTWVCTDTYALPVASIASLEPSTDGALISELMPRTGPVALAMTKVPDPATYEPDHLEREVGLHVVVRQVECASGPPAFRAWIREPDISRDRSAGPLLSWSRRRLARRLLD